MAVCRFVETPATPEQYDRVMARVAAGGASTEGRTVHIAAVGEDGKIRIFDVWDTQAQAEAFGEAVRTAREDVGITEEPNITILDVHNQILIHQPS
jgi:hypothetical protein